jgi:apolipoprotein N-acyltransferase
MKHKLNLITPVTASMLSGVLIYSIFPPFEFSFLAWIALVPLLLVLNHARHLRALFSGFLMGIILCGLHVYWLNMVPGFPLPAYLAIIFYVSSFFAIFSLLFSIVIKRTDIPKVVFAPVLWVTVEYLRSNLSFLAVPWVLLGQSQYQNLPIIQIASLTSVYGISFLIVFVNAAVAEGIIWVSDNFKRSEDRKSSLAITVASLISAFFLVGIAYLWGSYQIKSFTAKTSSVLKTSLIQGNIPQHKKWNTEEKKNILDHYNNLTIEASKEKPDLIVWPETATPGSLKEDEHVNLSVGKIVRATGIPLLTGSSSTGKLVIKGRKTKRDFNSAFLLDETGAIVSSYSKLRLLPFGEYVPFEGKFPWPRWLVPISGICVPGNHHTVFEFPKGKFGVVICWEILFPDLFRIFVQRGSEFMLNLTNEAWFGKTEASHQILAMSVFRAVENRVSVLRCANTGVTCLIDPVGRIRSKVVDEQGNDIMVTGILTVTVPKKGEAPFYSKYGDIFATICSIGAIVITVITVLPLNVRRYLKVTGDR